MIDVRRCTGQPFAAGLTRPLIPKQDHGRLTLRELTFHQQTHRQSLYQTVVLPPRWATDSDYPFLVSLPTMRAIMATVGRHTDRPDGTASHLDPAHETAPALA